MTNPGVEQRGVELLSAHQAGETFVPFTGSARIQSVNQAYDVQDVYVAALRNSMGGEAVAGYKIGLTSARMQAMLNIDSPIAGVVLQQRIHTTGFAVRLTDFGRLGIECEIAVRLGHDLVARDDAYSQDEVAQRVDAVCAAFELVDDRNADYSVTDIGSLIADNAWNAGLVLGPWHHRWDDLAAVEGIAWRNGEQLDSGYGADVLGHPFTPLTWLANHLSKRGQGLRAGDIIATGSLIPTRFPHTAEQARFVLAGLGEVSIDIS